MLRTSIGFHTFTVFQTLTANEAISLLKDFYNYMENTRNIRILDKDKRHKEYEVIYTTPHMGIRWRLRFYNQSADYKSYIVEATINPKVLVGTNDYIAAANEDYIEKTEAFFNHEARRISNNLAEFSSYSLNRIDYCGNFYLKELGIDCTPDIIMELIKRSNIPRRFVERTEYDKIAHRQKSYKNSFYLENKSVVINCYWKHKQLEENFPTCPGIDKALDVIRFEVQCRYKKVFSMSRKNRSSLNDTGIVFDMFSDIKAAAVVGKYYNSIILEGDYYRLKTAKIIVKSYHYKEEKESRLIETLCLISRYRSIPNARSTLSSKKEKDFNRALKELSDMGVNPVTIPKNLNIDHIPNLLEVYYELTDENSNR